MSSSKKVTGSHLIGKALQLEGVKHIFTIAGDHILPVLDVLTDMDFRFVDTRHEQAALHMADAWGRLTGQAHALHSESPVISISGSADLSELGRGAMQEIDQVGAAQAFTKGSWMV